MHLKITILYDNTAILNELKPDWGFACLIEGYGQKVLFDTGGHGAILMHNMRVLGISPKEIDWVFLSHNHFDHIGGLSTFLEENSHVRIISPPSLRGIRHAREVIYADQPMKIADHFYSTGELDHIEQSLIISTKKGVILIVGCAHPPMAQIIEAAETHGKIHAVIGGMHGFDQFTLLKDIEHLCPTHCTQHRAQLKALYPEACIEGGAGQIIGFADTGEKISC